MNRFLATVLAAVLLTALLGCGGEKDKGKFKDLDKPKPADKAG